MGRALAAVLVAACAAAPAPATAANLIADGDAEAAAATPQGTVVAVPSWKTLRGEFTAVTYASPVGGRPGPDLAARFGAGANYFAGGNQPFSSAEQVVDVSAYGALIDRGATATLSGLLGGFQGQQDSAKVTVYAINAAGTNTGPVFGLGPLSAAEREGATTFVSKVSKAPVPAGTRSLRVLVEMARTEGQFNDSYLDNLSLAIGPQHDVPRLTLRKRCKGRTVLAIVRGSGIASVKFVAGGRNLVDAKAPFAGSFKLGSLPSRFSITAIVSYAGGDSVTLRSSRRSASCGSL